MTACQEYSGCESCSMVLQCPLEERFHVATRTAITRFSPLTAESRGRALSTTALAERYSRPNHVPDTLMMVVAVAMRHADRLHRRGRSTHMKLVRNQVEG